MDLELFAVLHRLGAPTHKAITPWVQWTTCLRDIHFGSQEWCEVEVPGYELLRGTAAYCFTLEVICGLQSPVIGETEVLGQFKNFRHSQTPSETASQSLLKILDLLLVDSKKVRSAHLTGTGSRSYGSEMRRLLKGFDKIAVVGAGQLVEKVLPWITAESEVVVFCRDPIKVRAKFNEGSAKIQPLNILPTYSATAVIIAAPITSAEIQDLLNSKVQKVVDMRADSNQDVVGKFQTTTLNQFMSQFDDRRRSLENTASLAREEIAKISKRRAEECLLRPFGWEDLCASS